MKAEGRLSYTIKPEKVAVRALIAHQPQHISLLIHPLTCSSYTEEWYK
jgi:hypothetical protein